MFINGSSLNSSALDPSEQALHRPPWVTTTLGCFLIFTIVVDILGNLLVIFSVYRNKKLRNAGELRTRASTGTVMFDTLVTFISHELLKGAVSKETEEDIPMTGRIQKDERARFFPSNQLAV